MKYLIFPGSFKPPHIGHFKIIEKYSKDKTIDKIFIFISKIPRLIIPPFDKKLQQFNKKELSIIYKKYFNNKVVLKDKIYEEVNSGLVPGITLENSYYIWNEYIKLLKNSSKIKIFKSRLPSPIMFSFVVINKIIKKDDELLLVKSDKNSSNKRFSIFNTLKINIQEISIPKFKKFNSSEMRKAIYQRKKKEFIKYLPNNLENNIKNKIWKLF